MELTEDDVLQILKLMEESEFDELQLEMKGMKLVVRRGGAAAPAPELPPLPGKLASLPVGQQAVVIERTSKTMTRTAAPQSPVAKTEIASLEETGLVAITAPTLGTFYRAPKPGAPPFVELGSTVKEDDTVCLLEVMKCFFTVKANMRGEIAKICVENAQLVEFGQKLFLCSLSDQRALQR